MAQQSSLCWLEVYTKRRGGGVSLHLDDNVSLTKLKDAVGVKEGIPRQAKSGDGDIGGASSLMVLG